MTCNKTIAMTNQALIQKISAALIDRERIDFLTPFNMNTVEDGTSMSLALGVCIDDDEPCVRLQDGYVIPLEELTNRELGQTLKALKTPVRFIKGFDGGVQW